MLCCCQTVNPRDFFSIRVNLSCIWYIVCRASRWVPSPTVNFCLLAWTWPRVSWTRAMSRVMMVMLMRLQKVVMNRKVWVHCVLSSSVCCLLLVHLLRRVSLVFTPAVCWSCYPPCLNLSCNPPRFPLKVGFALGSQWSVILCLPLAMFILRSLCCLSVHFHGPLPLHAIVASCNLSNIQHWWWLRDVLEGN